MLRILLTAIVALTLALGWSLWRAEVHKGKADAAETRAADLADQLAAAQAAMVRDALADTETDTARTVVSDHAAAHHDRAERIEAIAHASRPPVPTDCPGPDADLVRESAEGRSRVRAAEGELRSLRRAADPGAG